MQTIEPARTFAQQRTLLDMEMRPNTISEEMFEQVFKSHFKALHAYACTILKEEFPAEEMVQQVFFKLWERKDQVVITQSLNAYLYRSVYNECLNYLKHQKVKQTFQAHASYTTQEGAESNIKILIGKELEQKIAEALNRLPEQCRTIFQLSRFENLKYREIAEKLQLSIKTIENQMGKALKIMRIELQEYLPSVLILINVAIALWSW